MQARRLPARHGALWVAAGFRLFRANPPLLTALTLGYLSSVIVINLVPLLGPVLLPVLLPMLTVVVANGCRGIEQGRAVNSLMLMTGIRKQREALIRLGGLHLVASITVLVISVAIEGGDLFSDQGRKAISEEELTTMLLQPLLIAAPIAMAYWFAPLLTGWEGLPALKAVFFSAIAAYRNWRAFLAYVAVVVGVGVVVPGLIIAVAGQIDENLHAIVAAVVHILQIFVVAPGLIASNYVSFRDVFTPDEDYSGLEHLTE